MNVKAAIPSNGNLSKSVTNNDPSNSAPTQAQVVENSTDATMLLKLDNKKIKSPC